MVHGASQAATRPRSATTTTTSSAALEHEKPRRRAEVVERDAHLVPKQ